MYRHPVTKKHSEVEASEMIAEHGRDEAIEKARRLAVADVWPYWAQVERDIRAQAPVETRL